MLSYCQVVYIGLVKLSKFYCHYKLAKFDTCFKIIKMEEFAIFSVIGDKIVDHKMIVRKSHDNFKNYILSG